jgi:phage terminase large subunit-like protein
MVKKPKKTGLSRRRRVGRPRLSHDEHVRRGTVQPCRARRKPAKKRLRKKPLSLDASSERFVTIADRYVADVLSGAIVACRWTKLACERFRRMRGCDSAFENAFAAKPFWYVWSPEHVESVCKFVSKLPHVEGRWSSSTIRLEPWQVFILAATYGFRRLDGGRLVNVVFFQVARKSAKSTLVAACALYHLVVEQEPGAQVVCGATTGSQARIVFSIMQRMVRRAAWLRAAGLVVYANSITCDAIGGYAKPINAKSSTQDGLNPSFISLDESHAQGFELHDVLKSAQGSRVAPMLMAPTTAGYSLTSVGYALRATAMKVLDGVLDADHLFCVLYELDDADDWQDETTWIKAAPMIGITPTLAYVRQYRDDAIATPGMQGEFEVKIANRWLHSASTWLSMPAWSACADATLTLDSFAHEPCWIGVDLAERDDIAAVALVFQRADLVYVFVRGYLPALVVSERSRAVPAYLEWVKSGELVVTDGNLTDYGRIEADLRQDIDRFDVRDLAIERYGALHLASNLTTDGVPARVESKNSKVFTGPAKELEARIKARQLRHTGSSFLTWQVSNVCVERRRDGTLLPTKDQPMSPNKIDAVDAILLGLSGLLAMPTEPPADPQIFFLDVEA